MMGRLDEFQLRARNARHIGPVYESFVRLAPGYGCNTTLQQAHFWAQVRLETNGLRDLEEHIFETKARQDYANKNGNTSPEDGWAFRGRGLLQTTGFSNYHDVFAHARGRDVRDHATLRGMAPELGPAEATADHGLAVESALYYWQHRPCHDCAAIDDALGASIRVNGWVVPPKRNYIPNGYQERVGYLAEAKRFLRLLR